MNKPRWVLAEVPQAIHKQQLAEHGGARGIRDQGRLEAALARPQTLFNYAPDQASIPRLAASYAFGLIHNHPFVDGNKRVALVVSFLLLRLNGLELVAPLEERYQTIMALANNELSEEELAAWFSANSH